MEGFLEYSERGLQPLLQVEGQVGRFFTCTGFYDLGSRGGASMEGLAACYFKGH